MVDITKIKAKLPTMQNRVSDFEPEEDEGKRRGGAVGGLQNP